MTQVNLPGAQLEPDFVAATRTWLERAVIGLNLCPFARESHLRGGIRYYVSEADSGATLMRDLKAELRALAVAEPADCETTLLIHPRILVDFSDYNDFLLQADAAVAQLDLEGVIQVASFHPAYRFANTALHDITNYTNRSPWPMLHLLREASVERAVRSHPDTTAIYRKNIATLEDLGIEGWRRLWIENGSATA